MRKIILLAAVLGLSACVTTQGEPEFDRSGPAPRPVSLQTSGGAAWTRAKAHTELGMAYLDTGRIPQALDEAKIAMGIDSGFPLVYNLLGLIHMNLRETGPADESFRQALSLAPGDPEISNNYAWFLCQSGRRAQSMAYFKAAYTNPLYPAAASAEASAGLCADQNADAKVADRLFGDALVKEPSNPRSLFLYADFLYRQGRFEDARMRLNELHRINETTVKSVWLALKVARKLGDRQGEARYSSLLRQRYSDSPEHEMMIQVRFE